MKKIFTKRNIKRLAAVVVIALLGGVIGSMAANNISFEKDLNENNIIKYEDYSLQTITNNGKGVELTVKDDGTLKLNGKATSDDEYTVAAYTLEAGTYTISGCDSKIDGAGLMVRFGTNEHYAGLSSDTFVLEAETTVYIIVYVKEDTVCLFKTIRPVLVKGEEPGDFYA